MIPRCYVPYTQDSGQRMNVNPGCSGGRSVPVDDKVKEEDRARIEQFMKNLKVDEPASSTQVADMLNFTVGDRGMTLYLIWKAIEKQYPEVDIVQVLRQVSWDRGLMPTSEWGEVRTPAEWMMKAFSRISVLSCKQVFTELNDQRATVVFERCPHMDAARAIGAPPEDVGRLCRDIMIACDYARIKPYPHLKISFPDGTCGDGKHCVLTVELSNEKAAE